MTIPAGTRTETRDVLVDAATGRELTQKEKAERWIVDFHARTGLWPTMREIIDGTGVGMGTAGRARSVVVNR